MKRTRVLAAIPLTMFLIAGSNSVAAAAERPAAPNLTELWGNAVDDQELPDLPDIEDIESLADMVNLPPLPPPPSVDDVKQSIADAQGTVSGGMSLAGDVTAWLGSPTGDNASRVISTALAGIPDEGQRTYAKQIWQDSLAGLNQAQQKMALAQGAADIAAEQFGEYSPQVLSAVRQATDTRMALAQQATSPDASTQRDEAEGVFTREGAREVDDASVDNAVEESKREALSDARDDEREAERAERDAQRSQEKTTETQSESADTEDSDQETSTSEEESTATESATSESEADTSEVEPTETGTEDSESEGDTSEEEPTATGAQDSAPEGDISDAEPVPPAPSDSEDSAGGTTDSESDGAGEEEASRSEALEQQNEDGVLGDANLANSQDISEADWEGLKDTLNELAGDKEIGIAAAPAGTGAGISAGNATAEVYPASMIKIPVAMAVQANLTPEDKVTVEDADLVGGTGDLEVGEYTIAELAFRMIATSDNSATNVLIDELGGEQEGMDTINELIEKAGGTGTTIDNLMMDEERSSTVTANGMTNVLKSLWAAAEGTETDILTADQAKPVLEAMSHQQYRSKLPGQVELPEDGSAGTILNKTGEADQASHDAGYIARDGKVVAVTVTTELGEEATDTVAEVGKKIYDWIDTIPAADEPEADEDADSAGESPAADEDADSAGESPAANEDAATADDGESETTGTTESAPPADTTESDTGGDDDVEQHGEEATSQQQDAADEYSEAAKEFLSANKKVLEAVDGFVEVAYETNKLPDPKSDERDAAFDKVKEAQADETDKWETMREKEDAAREAGFDDEELENWRKDTADQMVIKRDLELDSPDKGSEFNEDEEVQDAYSRLHDD